MTTETKKGLICLTLGVGLAWLIVYLLKREKKGDKDMPIITDESITVAVNAYKNGMDAGEPQENLDEINNQLKEEFGLTVEYKPLQNKYIVYDSTGKKLKEV
jgi:hypothetical protein